MDKEDTKPALALWEHGMHDQASKQSQHYILMSPEILKQALHIVYVCPQ